MKFIIQFTLLVVTLCLQGKSSSAQIIKTIAGTGSAGHSGDGGPATSATTNTPAHIVCDARGNLFFTEQSSHTIRKINSSSVISTIAGTGVAGYSGDGGPASAARLHDPNGIAIDKYGNLFFADWMNNVIRKIDTTGIITTIAGNGSAGYSGDGMAATSSSIGHSSGICVDGAGNIFLSDYSTHRIRKIDVGGIIHTIGGTGVPGFSGDGGQATNAKIAQPTSVAADRYGNLIITDQLNNRVRKIDTAGIITTIAGSGVSGYSGDGGAATAAKLYYPSDARVADDTSVFFVDAYNNCVRMVNGHGIISTVAGTGVPGFSGDGGPATAAKLNLPTGNYFTPCGDLLICDYSNHRVREVLFFKPMPHSTGRDTIFWGDTTVLLNPIGSGTWHSLDISRATVNATTGIVRGLAAGAARIVYTSICGVDTFTITIRDRVGIGNVANSPSVVLYPNPFSDCFTLSGHISGLSEQASIEIFDIAGRMVYCTSTEVIGGSVEKAICTNGQITTGVYILKVRGGSGQYITRLEVR